MAEFTTESPLLHFEIFFLEAITFSVAMILLAENLQFLLTQGGTIIPEVSKTITVI